MVNKGIEWLGELHTNYDDQIDARDYNIDYKNWKKHIIVDKKKFDDIIIKYHIDKSLCPVKRIKAKVELTRKVSYEMRTTILWISSKEEAEKIYQYVKEKLGKNLIKKVKLFYDTYGNNDYKYVLIFDFIRKNLILPEVKQDKDAGVYDYKVAKRRFGNFGSILYDMFDEKCFNINPKTPYYFLSKLYDKTINSKYYPDVKYIFDIINVPLDKIYDYANEIKHNLEKAAENIMFDPYYLQIHVTTKNNSTIHIEIFYRFDDDVFLF
jgi:hypothetical protein